MSAAPSGFDAMGHPVPLERLTAGFKSKVVVATATPETGISVR